MSYIAIDAGGSRIRGYESISGGEFEGSGVTHTNSLALDLAAKIANAVPKEICEVDTLVLSLAAIPQKSRDIELLAAALFQSVRFQDLIIASDTKAAALSGSSRADLTIAVGTGITALVNMPDHNFELTGHGYLIGDEASGFWIGRTGLNAALRAEEGRGPDTSLLKAAEDFYQVPAQELADYLHQLPTPVAQIAAFAPKVIEAANNGDAEALFIISQAANEIAVLIEVAIERANIKTVALVGGAIPHGELLHKQVLTAAQSLQVQFIVGTAEPLQGARKIVTDSKLQSDLITIFSSEISSSVWSQLYLTKAQELIGQVSHTQIQPIAASVELFANALANGKMIHTFGTGHSHLLAEEIFYRAGGLAAIYPMLDERLMLHKEVVKGSQNERLPGLAQELVDSHPIVSGDVVVVISNSGGNQVTIDLVKLAQSMGAKVIAVTSINHATSSSARSKSAEKIHQLADVVLDNSGVVGDAAVRVASARMSVAPTSTVIGGALLQSVVVGTVAELIARGIEPEIFLSSNLAGGDENNAAIFDKYRPLIDLYN
ncbi:hypothetical protein GM51_7140 [freshwater metagenome]|uniref:SIS domain-containing protein n=1 Tax=freshwater metagenome TaxID=449393 RepID=A0A094QXH9_9ZZZZ